MSKLYFFRHAQASFGSDNYDQLSKKGEEQAALLGKYLIEQQIKFDKVFVGPLQRQKHTFEIIIEVFNKNKIFIPNPILLEELKEHSGTKATRQVVPQLMKTDSKVQQWATEAQQNPKLYKRNTLLIFQHLMGEWACGNLKVDGLETWDVFRKEVKKGLDKILEQTNKGETIGAFTSGGTISCIVAEALYLKDEKRVAEMNFSVRNTSFTTFLYNKNNFNLLSFNELPHLEKDMITFV